VVYWNWPNVKKGTIPHTKYHSFLPPSCSGV
jgi:hypothetical protein